jgi:EAL domain-containing protein (putative c-di-GMP-specific phosphodiesterase class I)
VAQALIGLARSLGRNVIASGITREAQRHWLAAAGCIQLQGPALVRAMTRDELGRWLAEFTSSASPAASSRRC